MTEAPLRCGGSDRCKGLDGTLHALDANAPTSRTVTQDTHCTSPTFAPGLFACDCHSRRGSASASTLWLSFPKEIYVRLYSLVVIPEGTLRLPLLLLFCCPSRRDSTSASAHPPQSEPIAKPEIRHLDPKRSAQWKGLQFTVTPAEPNGSQRSFLPQRLVNDALQVDLVLQATLLSLGLRQLNILPIQPNGCRRREPTSLLQGSTADATLTLGVLESFHNRGSAFSGIPPFRFFLLTPQVRCLQVFPTSSASFICAYSARMSRSVG